MPEATSLAAELKSTLGVEAELIEGSRGVFDVRRDGTLIYSKYETDRFPRAGEVPALLQ
ncbi:MAG: Rdx family protein [Candidatus Sericytochromatia bacterium]